MTMSHWLPKQIFFHLCSQIEVGCLTLVLPDGTTRSFGQVDSPVQAEMCVSNESIYLDLLSQADWGLGWGFVDRKWDSKAPRNVALIFMLNEHVFKPYVPWMNRLSPAMRVVTLQNRLDQSAEEEIRKRTVSACYDVGNDFFGWVLGPSMVYTCAIWPHADASLEEAQENKLRIVTEKARIDAGHRVLDLGCGWGTLCDYIQRTTGARVRGVALAREQIDWARGHHPDCEFEYADYPSVGGSWDRIVSVGMAEHVGREKLDEFMQQVSELLVPGGRFVMHTMCSYDDVLMMNATERWTSFASVAMPNGDVPSFSNVIRSAMKTGDLRLVHSETFGVHYARTGNAWARNLERNRERIVEAYSERLYRTYEYSWAMGSSAFETGLSLAHFVFEKQPYGSPLTHSSL
jgi:cyclopropane-fatty-acyl-phospholipid synthase